MATQFFVTNLLDSSHALGRLPLGLENPAYMQQYSVLRNGPLQNNTYTGSRANFRLALCFETGLPGRDNKASSQSIMLSGEARSITDNGFCFPWVLQAWLVPFCFTHKPVRLAWVSRAVEGCVPWARSKRHCKRPFYSNNYFMM